MAKMKENDFKGIHISKQKRLTWLPRTESTTQIDRVSKRNLVTEFKFSLRVRIRTSNYLCFCGKNLDRRGRIDLKTSVFPQADWTNVFSGLLQAINCFKCSLPPVLELVQQTLLGSYSILHAIHRVCSSRKGNILQAFEDVSRKWRVRVTSSDRHKAVPDFCVKTGFPSPETPDKFQAW